MLKIKETAEGITFEVRVMPRSSRSEVAGLQEGALRLRINSPPVEGRANEECIRLLAGLFGLAKSKIRIRSGQKSKTKVVVISDISRGEAEKTLREMFKV